MSPRFPREQPPRPSDDAPFQEKLDWLLATHAYNEETGMVVDLYEASADCQMTMEEFNRRFAHWHEVVEEGSAKR